MLLDLGEKSENSGFKLTAELSACNKCGKVDQKDLLITKLVRNVAVSVMFQNTTRYSFRMTRFAKCWMNFVKWVAFMFRCRAANV